MSKNDRGVIQMREQQRKTHDHLEVNVNVFFSSGFVYPFDYVELVIKSSFIQQLTEIIGLFPQQTLELL